MNTLEKYLELVETEIAKSITQNDSLTPTQLYDPVKYILYNGGKRIRALFVMVAAHLVNKQYESAIPAAIGIEIFHNFTLLHDDIMDKADIRRGQPTVHKKWDENTAILSGDAMMIIAQQMINKCPVEVLPKILDLFSKTAIEVCEGQQLDVNLEQIDLKTENIAEADYIEMIRLKTSVLIAASLKIGAIVGGASDDIAQKLYDYGLNIGLAFQIQDDYLDSFGDEATFGKKIGGDILEGKKTYLLIKALENGSAEQKEILTNLINLRDIDGAEKIATIKSIYHALDIPQLAQDKINELFLHADSIIKGLELVPEALQNLNLLVAKLRNRNK